MSRLSPIVGRFLFLRSLSRLVEAKRLVSNVQRGVHIPVVLPSAMFAHPFAFGQPQSLVLVPAVVAEFGTRVEPVHLDEGATIPFRLVGELVDALNGKE